MVEAVERCLLQRYCESNGSDGLLDGLAPESLIKVRDFLNSRDEETRASVMNDVAFAAFLKDYTSFRQGVSNGTLGKTAQFWLTVRVVEINELRCAMLTQKCGGTLQAIDHKKSVDLSTLPPTKTCLREHIKRVNYQVAIWKRRTFRTRRYLLLRTITDGSWLMTTLNLNGTRGL